MRPPIAVISRRAANSPITNYGSDRVPRCGRTARTRSLPIGGEDARPVVGDVDLDLAVPSARRRCCSRPPAPGAYFDSFSRSCSSTWRNRVSSPIAMNEPSGRCQRMGCGRSRRRSVSTVSSTAATASNGARDSPVSPSPDRRQDGVDEAVQSRDLVERGRAPRPGIRGDGLRRLAGRGVGQQVDGGPDHRERGSAARSDHREQLGSGCIERGQLFESRLDLGRQAALLDDAGEQGGDGLQEYVSSRPNSRTLRVWTLSTPTTWSCPRAARKHPGERLDPSHGPRRTGDPWSSRRAP